jgi:hypothetical protein
VHGMRLGLRDINDSIIIFKTFSEHREMQLLTIFCFASSTKMHGCISLIGSRTKGCHGNTWGVLHTLRRFSELIDEGFHGSSRGRHRLEAWWLFKVIPDP